MAITSSFAFTNATEGAKISTTAIGAVTNYGKKSDEPTEAIITNKTCPTDQGELITYRARDISAVNSSLQILNPAKVLNGVEFGVRVDEILRTKDSDGSTLYDEPIVATLTVKAPKSSNVTSAVITTVVSRLLGACYDETKNAYRWDDLMRSCLVPIEN